MLNHLKNLFLGSNRDVLAGALLLWEILFFACPLQPSPPRGTREVRQIVELVDSRGRRIYINTQEQDSGSRIGYSSQNNCSGLAGQNPGPVPCSPDEVAGPLCTHSVLVDSPRFRRSANEAGTPLARLIGQAADHHQLDPDLIRAIVNAESGCDSRALSRKGAMGFMQLIPATARRFGVEDPFDPNQNIQGGTSYLKYLLGLFDGDLTLSLAAYNAGENLVLRKGGIPPFPETRDYVRKVRSFYQFASASHASEGPKSVAKTGKATAQAGRPIGAPLDTYVDGQGVLHIEQ